MLIMKAIATMKPRGTDPMGDGSFGASRGGRTHNGIDYASEPGDVILSPVAGKVTKLGYPYANALEYRYVEITDNMQRKWRLFYVHPSVELGQEITPAFPIGITQDINAKRTVAGGQSYGEKGMTNHIHVEVKLADGSFMDPDEVFA